jgi:hypothetical protein
MEQNLTAASSNQTDTIAISTIESTRKQYETIRNTWIWVFWSLVAVNVCQLIANNAWPSEKWGYIGVSSVVGGALALIPVAYYQTKVSTFTELIANNSAIVEANDQQP